MDFVVAWGCAVVLAGGIYIHICIERLLCVGITLIVLASLGLLWVVARKITNFLMFPGSLWIFRRSLELNYSKELSQQIYIKLVSLSNYLQNVKEANEDEQTLHEQNSIRLVSTLIENFESLKKKSRMQKKTLNALLDVKEALEHVEVNVNNINISLWNWLDIRKDNPDAQFLYLKTEENERFLMNAGKALKSILVNLKNTFQKKGCLSGFFRYFYDYNFGTLQYMRVDLENRFETKEVVINGVSSMFLRCREGSERAVMICNPNAGFYEFTYFQSDWLEFYMSLNVSVILWNYRGYGASKGTPNLKKLIQDGTCILKHYQSLYSLKTIALHGESIGGSIAIHIASSLPTTFLLADRTFGRLSDIILYKYGLLPYLFFKLTLHPDIENASVFLSLPNYKLITNDPNDCIISDLVSLKSSVASNFALKKIVSNAQAYYKNEWKTVDYILTCKEYTQLLQALKRLREEFNKKTVQNDKYKVYVKTEEPEQSPNPEVIKKLKSILKGLDSCGVFLSDESLYQDEFFLKLWVMTFEIWGSGRTGQSAAGAVFEVARDLKELVNDFSFITNSKMQEDCQVITECVLKIVNAVLENNSRIGNSLRTEENFQVDYSKAGCFMMVTCGHGGQFTHTFRHKFESHLYHSGFI